MKKFNVPFAIIGVLILYSVVCSLKIYSLLDDNAKTVALAKKNQVSAVKQLSLAEQNEQMAHKRLFDLLRLNKKNLEALEKAYEAAKDQNSLKKDLAKAYDDFSWYLLLGRKYNEALSYATKSTELAGIESPYSSNLMIAYILTSQYNKAEAVFSSLKGKSYEGIKYEELTMGSLRAIEKEGIKHSGLERALRKFTN